MIKKIFVILIVVLLLASVFVSIGFGQKKSQNRQDEKVRTVTVPISIFTKKEQRENRADEFVQAGDLTVTEDNEEQVILSIRSVSSSTPLALAVLIQDDLTSETNLKLDEIRKFIRALPRGSRVMVAYLRAGTIQVRQKFTEDLEKAAKSLRILAGNSAAPGSPYEGVEEALKRFDALPAGRRAILLVSDGLDASRGYSSSSPSQSIDLDRAILRAQRKSVAVYSIYSPASLTENGNSMLTLNGQGSLARISDETGGRAFFQGSIAPLSFEPFFADLNLALNRQFALTYLSTHMKKGYHKLKVTSSNPEVKIEHPRGYYYR